MSDLISRSALIEILEDYENDDWNKNVSAMLPSVVDDCIDFIENMPIAYDIDKVVEELDKSSKWVNETNEYGDDDGNDYIPLSKAIEIVKHGGVADYVCEWKLFNNALFGRPQWVYETTCGKYVGGEHTSKAFIYCPYCSKKIKVV